MGASALSVWAGGAGWALSRARQLISLPHSHSTTSRGLHGMSILTEQEQFQFNSFLTDFESPPTSFPPAFPPAFPPYPSYNSAGPSNPPAYSYTYAPQPSTGPYHVKLSSRAQQAKELEAWLGTSHNGGPKALAQLEHEREDELVSKPWDLEHTGGGLRVPQDDGSTLRRLEEAERAAGFGTGGMSGRSESAERRVAVERSIELHQQHQQQAQQQPQPRRQLHQPAPPILKQESPPLPEQTALISAPYTTPFNIPPSPPGRSRPIPVPSAPRLPPLPTPSQSQQSPPPAAGSTQLKPALLTAQQKKANHIASESRRRAQIRKAYDRLVEVVPLLKAAVEAEKAEAASSKASKGKKAAKGKKSKGEENADGDKLDGRSGPKSEAVVLTKSEYRSRTGINELLQGRTLTRSALPPQPWIACRSSSPLERPCSSASRARTPRCSTSRLSDCVTPSQLDRGSGRTNGSALWTRRRSCSSGRRLDSWTVVCAPPPVLGLICLSV